MTIVLSGATAFLFVMGPTGVRAADVNDNARSERSVPFVGCPSDGQVGYLGPPEGKGVTFWLTKEEADGLAFYKAEMGPGVLAPRKWHCFGEYGSSGSTLFVTPQHIDRSAVFSAEPRAFTGPVVALASMDGGTSGRSFVADVIARVFPAYRSFAVEVARMFDKHPRSLPKGPYPGDTLHRRSSTVVEYETPARTDGLGTGAWVGKGDLPICGAAVLLTRADQAPQLLLLAVRVPEAAKGMTPAITQAVERGQR